MEAISNRTPKNDKKGNNGGSNSPAVGPSKICQFKLVLLGESAVGKSSLVLRFVKGQFHEYQESTIGGVNLIFELANFLDVNLIPKLTNVLHQIK